MGNSIVNWIEQWLTDRVVVDGEVSSWKSVLSGVPVTNCQVKQFEQVKEKR